SGCRPERSGRSIRSTSAPRSARTMQPNGAGARLATSTTLTPLRGPVRVSTPLACHAARRPAAGRLGAPIACLITRNGRFGDRFVLVRGAVSRDKRSHPGGKVARGGKIAELSSGQGWLGGARAVLTCQRLSDHPGPATTATTINPY